MTRTPYFSVVTPSFNQGEWVDGCIQSVLAQGVDDFEHIIFDNCSTDSTSEVFARYPHLSVHREADRGQSDALNKAMARASGEIICWLNTDDRYRPGAFAAVRQAFADPSVTVIYGDAEEVFFDGRPTAIRPARFPCREDILIWWEKRTDLLQPSVFFRRSLLAHTGPLRDELHFIMDTEFWWRLAEYAAFHRVDFAFSTQLRQPDSKTIRSVHRIYEEKRRYFTPLLNAAEPEKVVEHARASRRGLCNRYIGFAQSLAKSDRPGARLMLRRALSERPLCALSSTWWKALYFCTIARPCASHG